MPPGRIRSSAGLDMGVGSHHRRHPPVQIKGQGQLFGGGLGVEIHHNVGGGYPLQQPVHTVKGILQGIHVHRPLEVDDTQGKPQPVKEGDPPAGASG